MTYRNVVNNKIENSDIERQKPWYLKDKGTHSTFTVSTLYHGVRIQL